MITFGRRVMSEPSGSGPAPTGRGRRALIGELVALAFVALLPAQASALGVVCCTPQGSTHGPKAFSSLTVTGNVSGGATATVIVVLRTIWVWSLCSEVQT
jgi:hypothetical protein